MDAIPPMRVTPASPLDAVNDRYPVFQPGSASTTQPAQPEYPTGQPVVPPQELPGRSRSPHRLLRSPATYLLLGINIAVFCSWCAPGVNGWLPNEMQLIHFGANNAILVLHGQWWRLITGHVRARRLCPSATNMWCLWNLGVLGEPLLGFSGMLAVYLLTGAAGQFTFTSGQRAF